jgi:chemotaxis protein histidine kinase CheA
MSTELDPEVEEAIAALRVAYVRELGPKLEEVVQALTRARAALARGEAAAAGLQASYRLAHRLFGSTGAYGLDEVAAPLGVIEAHLYEAVEGERAVDEAWWTTVDEALTAATRAGAERCAGAKLPHEGA